MTSKKVIMFLISVMLLSNILLVLATKSEKHNDDSHQHLNALLRIKKKAKVKDAEDPAREKIWNRYIDSQISRLHVNRRKFIWKMFNQRDPIEEQVEHLTENGKVMYENKHEAGRIVGRFMFDRAKEYRNKSRKIQREMLDLKKQASDP